MDEATKNKPTPPEDEQFVREYIEAVYWKTAKSYSKTAPHQYTIREWEPERDHEFVRFAEIIRKYGYPERFYRKIHWYFQVGEYKYWTMGFPLDETIVINRAGVNETYGFQAPIKEFPREAPF